MEMRQHPRISVPLLVEISNAALGKRETTAKDLSDGGVFVYLDDHTLQIGTAVKIKLKTTHVSDTQTAPTVEANVVRVETDGVALAFKNKTAHHLWASVERLRDELVVGRDYFQAYEAFICQHAVKGILFVQQNGKWSFPGHFLKADTPIEQLRTFYLDANLGLSPSTSMELVGVENFSNPVLPESSTLCLVHRMEVSVTAITLPSESCFKDYKWVSREKDLRDLTVPQAWVRSAAEVILKKPQPNHE